MDTSNDIQQIKHLKTAKEQVCEECIKTGSDWMHLKPAKPVALLYAATALPINI